MVDVCTGLGRRRPRNGEERAGGWQACRMHRCTPLQRRSLLCAPFVPRAAMWVAGRPRPLRCKHHRAFPPANTAIQPRLKGHGRSLCYAPAAQCRRRVCSATDSTRRLPPCEAFPHLHEVLQVALARVALGELGRQADALLRVLQSCSGPGQQNRKGALICCYVRRLPAAAACICPARAGQHSDITFQHGLTLVERAQLWMSSCPAIPSVTPRNPTNQGSLTLVERSQLGVAGRPVGVELESFRVDGGRAALQRLAVVLHRIGIPAQRFGDGRQGGWDASSTVAH